MFRLVRLGALISALAVLLAITVTVPGASAGTAAQTSVPVVFVHGFYQDNCPGLNVSSAMGGPKMELQAGGWTGNLDVVSYYACDQGGSRIGSDTDDTPIQTIAKQLANYLYKTYSSRGQTVDLVAHSMGGLVARTAIEFTESKATGFPPYLRVQRVVTFSTPFRGVGPSTITAVPGLAGTVQASEVSTGSSLLQSLTSGGAANASGGTSWLVIGSSGGCDIVPGRSAVAMPGALKIRYTGCWTHVQYLTNWTQTRSYGAYKNGTATMAYGPLELMRLFLTLP